MTPLDFYLAIIAIVADAWRELLEAVYVVRRFD